MLQIAASLSATVALTVLWLCSTAHCSTGHSQRGTDPASAHNCACNNHHSRHTRCSHRQRLPISAVQTGGLGGEAGMWSVCLWRWLRFKVRNQAVCRLQMLEQRHTKCMSSSQLQICGVVLCTH